VGLSNNDCRIYKEHNHIALRNISCTLHDIYSSPLPCKKWLPLFVCCCFVKADNLAVTPICRPQPNGNPKHNLILALTYLPSTCTFISVLIFHSRGEK
jgi:hypothetical protein